MNVSQCRLSLTRACDSRSGSFGSLPPFTEKLPSLHPRYYKLDLVDPVTCAAFAAWAPARPGPGARRKRRSAPRLLRRAKTNTEAGAPSMAQGDLEVTECTKAAARRGCARPSHPEGLGRPCGRAAQHWPPQGSKPGGNLRTSQLRLRKS